MSRSHGMYVLYNISLIIRHEQNQISLLHVLMQAYQHLDRYKQEVI